MESNKSRNRHERNFSSEIDYDLSLSDYNTIQSLNKSSKYKNYINTVYSTHSYLTKTITNTVIGILIESIAKNTVTIVIALLTKFGKL